MPRNEDGHLVPKSFKKPMSRREFIAVGLGIPVATVVAAAIGPSTAEKVIKFFGATSDKNPLPEPTPANPHFISPHLGYTLENNENWATGSDVQENGSYLDYFILDPNRTQDQPLSPQISITVTRVDSSITSAIYAGEWTDELYKMHPSAQEDMHRTAFQIGPKICNEDSTLVTTPTIEGARYHAAFFIKNNIAYTFCYVADENEYAAKDENEITNFHKMSLMRSSLRITGAPEFAFVPQKNNL